MTMSESTTHDVIYVFEYEEKLIRALCACGASWTHELKTPDLERKEIYKSHLKHFNRPKMETL